MSPADLVPYDGQTVELRFLDGERIRARIVSVDPHVGENHVFYVILNVLQWGTERGRLSRVGGGYACSAQDIAALTPSDD